MGRLLTLALLFASASTRPAWADTPKAAVAAPVRVAQAAPTSGSSSPSAIRVAIIPSIAVNLDTARVDALSQDLAEALMTELEIEAVGGLEIRRQLPADGVPADCVTTPACTSDVARRTGASQLLFVVMVDSGAGGSVQIDTTWVDAATSVTASRPAIDLASATEARAKFSAVARQLLPDAPIRAKTNGGGGGGVSPPMTEGVPRHFSTPAKITAAVGVVGLGMGIAFGLTARSKFRACDSAPLTCTPGKEDSISNYALLADTGFVIGAAAAVATVVLYFTSSEEPRVIVSPTPDGAAVSAFGRF